MQVLIELNTKATSRANEFAIETPEAAARRNTILLRGGKEVNWIVIGAAESPALARTFIEKYREEHQSGLPAY